MSISVHMSVSVKTLESVPSRSTNDFDIKSISKILSQVP